PGVPLIGEMNAVKMIQQYGSLDKLYKHADEIKGKRGENLRKFKEQAYLSKKLVTIDCDVPLKVDYNALALKKFNEVKLARIFTELGFNRLLTQLGLAASSGIQPIEVVADNFGEPASSKTVTHDYHLIDTQKKFNSFITQLKKQKLFAIDTETTAINAMRADLVGISFSWQQGVAFYLPLRTPLGAKYLELTYVRRKLAPILADENVKKIGQNIKYDMLVSQNAEMPIKGVYFDTMVASYCLEPQRSHSLDKMAFDFLDYECIPISAVIGKGKNQLTFDMVDTTTGCEYAA
ncbi:unnamed protein product, partial [marine sediment metagenome]